MKYLVYCICEHGLDRHDAHGCAGDGRRPCRCRRDQDDALDSAIEDARRHPWGVPQPTADAAPDAA